MASSLLNDSTYFYPKYYFELKDVSKKRYDDKPKLINCKKHEKRSFKHIESPDTFYSVAFQWHEWPDLTYPYVYSHLILIQSLYHIYIYIYIYMKPSCAVL